MENSTYLYVDDTKIIESQMNLFLLPNDVDKAIKCLTKTGWNSTWQSLKLYVLKIRSVKELDQCIVPLYADDTEIT